MHMFGESALSIHGYVVQCEVALSKASVALMQSVVEPDPRKALCKVRHFVPG